MTEGATLSERVHVAIWLLRRSEGCDELSESETLVRAAISVLSGEP